jgi:hypothetical protein
MAGDSPQWENLPEIGEAGRKRPDAGRFYPGPVLSLSRRVFRSIPKISAARLLLS